MAIRSTLSIGYKSPPVSFMSERAFRAHMLNIGRRYGKKMQNDWLSIVKTWKSQPEDDFKPEITYTHGFLRVSIEVENEIIFFLNNGTDIRWAVMSNPFQPKTKARVIGSYVGEGGAVVRGRKKMTKMGIGAMPGIEAREWDKEIVDTHLQDMIDEVVELTLRFTNP